jgi:hypothetical protein
VSVVGYSGGTAQKTAYLRAINAQPLEYAVRRIFEDIHLAPVLFIFSLCRA